MARESFLARLERRLLHILGPADVMEPGSQRPAAPSTEPTGDVIEGDFYRSDRAVEPAASDENHDGGPRAGDEHGTPRR